MIYLITITWCLLSMANTGEIHPALIFTVVISCCGAADRWRLIKLRSRNA